MGFDFPRASNPRRETGHPLPKQLRQGAPDENITTYVTRFYTPRAPLGGDLIINV